MLPAQVIVLKQLDLGLCVILKYGQAQLFQRADRLQKQPGLLIDETFNEFLISSEHSNCLWSDQLLLSGKGKIHSPLSNILFKWSLHQSHAVLTNATGLSRIQTEALQE